MPKSERSDVEVIEMGAQVLEEVSWEDQGFSFEPNEFAVCEAYGKSTFLTSSPRY